MQQTFRGPLRTKALPSEILIKHPKGSLLPSNDGMGTGQSMLVTWLTRMTVLGIRRTGPQQPWQREERGDRTRARRHEEKLGSGAWPLEMPLNVRHWTNHSTFLSLGFLISKM